MRRLAAFWREFVDSFGFLGKAVDAWGRFGRFILILLTLLLTALGTVTKGKEVNWLEWLQPWSPYVFVVLGAIVVWKAGRAWEKTFGPIIWIGNMEIDEQY